MVAHVATSRPYPGGPGEAVCDEDGSARRRWRPENRADLADYVAGRLGLSSHATSGDPIYNGVLDAAQGNFLIANALIERNPCRTPERRRASECQFGPLESQKGGYRRSQWIILAAAPRFGGSALAPSRAVGFSK